MDNTVWIKGVGGDCTDGPGKYVHNECARPLNKDLRALFS
jgi:hypothetical protein